MMIQIRNVLKNHFQFYLLNDFGQKPNFYRIGDVFVRYFPL